MALTKLFRDFFNSERSAGILLIGCTILSLLLTNSNLGDSYLQIWNAKVSGESVTHWINDGLMAIFFLMIGLELEREIYKGELSDIKKALLPVMAAIGGILVPAAIYFFLNYSSDTKSGIGIPMATDIAFALGILSLLGKRVPVSLKIFLAALAITDDIGAILVIAIFYTTTISWINILIAAAIFVFLGVLNRLKVFNFIPYLIGGIAAWYFMLHSGVHATITGVILAFVIPFGSGSSNSLSYKLQHFLHTPVNFIILPLFALANTAIIIVPDWYNGLFENYALGIFGGLVIGKPVGIVLFSILIIKSGLAALPKDVSFKQLVGTGFLGGIGFTMSIFITLLAFDNLNYINGSKIAILLSSLIAGITGFAILKSSIKN
ncbi:MAG: Na+/H+ antiporter NhaA [Bacteroidetes bacterium]|nr:Na+/H+ antiporter NhaA [Bacteroidota bacterium]